MIHLLDPIDAARAVKLLLRLFAAMAAATAFFLVVTPDLMASGAYDLAFRLVPIGVVGALYAATAVLLAVGSFTFHRHVVAVGVGLFAWLQFLFGTSILWLTLLGTTSAIVGAFQWWCSAAVALLLLRMLGVASETATKGTEWDG